MVSFEVTWGADPDVLDSHLWLPTSNPYPLFLDMYINKYYSVHTTYQKLSKAWTLRKKNGRLHGMSRESHLVRRRASSETDQM